jgi:hypothetical protein
LDVFVVVIFVFAVAVVAAVVVVRSNFGSRCQIKPSLTPVAACYLLRSFSSSSHFSKWALCGPFVWGWPPIRLGSSLAGSSQRAFSCGAGHPSTWEAPRPELRGRSFLVGLATLAFWTALCVEASQQAFYCGVGHPSFWKLYGFIAWQLAFYCGVGHPGTVSSAAQAHCRPFFAGLATLVPAVLFSDWHLTVDPLVCSACICLLHILPSCSALVVLQLGFSGKYKTSVTSFPRWLSSSISQRLFFLHVPGTAEREG